MNFFKQPPVIRGDYANHFIYGHWLFAFGFGAVYLFAYMMFGGHPMIGVFPVAVGGGLALASIFAALREATRPEPDYKDMLITIGGAAEAAVLIYIGTIVDL